MHDASPALSVTDELKERTAAFYAILARLQAGYDRAADDDLYAHLARLFFLHFHAGGWSEVTALVGAARQVESRHGPYRHRLTFYEAMVAYKTDDVAHADELYSTLMRLDEADCDVYTRLRTFNGLAILRMDQNRYDGALELYDKVYRLALAQNDIGYQAVALTNRSMVYHDLGYLDRAIADTEQSIPLFRALNDTAQEAVAVYTIGHAALYLGRWARAREMLAQAETLAVTYTLAPRLCYVYWARGVLEHLTGDPARSEACFWQAHYHGLQQGNNAAVGEALWSLAFLHHTQGRIAEALVGYDVALVLAERLNRPHQAVLIRAQRARLFADRGEPERARAACVEAIRQLERLRGDSTGEETRIGLLGSTQPLYELMIDLCLQADDIPAAFEYTERARARALLDALTVRNGVVPATLTRPVVTLAEVQRRLAQAAADTLLLEYVTLGATPPGDGILRHLPTSHAYLRHFLSVPPRTLVFAVSATAATVHELTLAPDDVQPPANSRDPVGRLLLPHRLTALYRALIKPVEAEVRRAPLVTILPHGPLHYVPWMALRSARGRYLLEQDGPALALAPSATILYRTPTTPAEGDFLALGYNGSGTTTLTHAEPEARVLAALMGGRAWTGPAPKSIPLIHYPRPLRGLHISCHGTFNPTSPLDSTLIVGADDRPRARDILHEWPLHATLVTLSACTSGRAAIAPGDEPMGLPRAFLYAGARTVVCAPWEARDRVALLVMEQFYRGLRDGHTPAAALRNAQVALRTLTGRDLLTTLARWRHEYPADRAIFDDSVVPAHQLQARPFAAPRYWALFYLVGQG